MSKPVSEEDRVRAAQQDVPRFQSFGGTEITWELKPQLTKEPRPVIGARWPNYPAHGQPPGLPDPVLYAPLGCRQEDPECVRETICFARAGLFAHATPGDFFIVDLVAVTVRMECVALEDGWATFQVSEEQPLP